MTREELLSQVRTAAEARWPGCMIETQCTAFNSRDFLAIARAVYPMDQGARGLRGLRGEWFVVGESESDAWDRLLAELRRE